MLALVFGWCRRDKNGLGHDFLELVEPQWTIVERTGQAKTIVDQVFLSRPVALVHAADLRDRHVTFVEDHQRVERHVVQQGRRRFAGFAAGKMPRVVLDALAEPQFVHHFQIEARPLLDALGLHQLAGLVVLLEALAQFDLDGLDGAQGGTARCDIVAGRVDGVTRHFLNQLSCQRVEQGQRFDFVVEQRDSQCRLRTFRRENVQHVPPHPERPAAKLEFVAFVLHLREPRYHVTLAHFLVLAQVQDHAVIIDGIADAVDRGNGGHDHRVIAFQQGFGCRQAHLLDVLVDAGILLDEQVTRRNVRFRLVVVVIRHEVLDRIFREELAHFRIELRRQRLVGRHDDRRPPGNGDHVGHGVGLTGSGHAEQRLESQAVAETLH